VSDQQDRLAAATTCPVCGTPGRIVGSDEGTQHFAATPPQRAALDVDSEVELMRAALHEQGIGCKPNTIHCRATHRGHANRIVSSLHALREQDA